MAKVPDPLGLYVILATGVEQKVREIAESNNETEINAATEVYNRRKTYDKNNPRS